MIIRFYKSFLLLLLFFNTTLRRMIITSIIGATTDGINNYYHKVCDQSAVLDGGSPGNDYQGGTLHPRIIVESDDGNNDNRQTDNMINQGNRDSSLYVE
ncbi:MAG TPA: hypothetical protein VHJ38_11220 [Nitrososphaeraceae archaeon]|nr:hypothetical protein [Nitrososphaeraceae archaeon]